MTTPFDINDTIAEILRRHPAAARVFESAGLDYCCGGGSTLEAACREKGIVPGELLAALQSSVSGVGGEPAADHPSLSPAALMDDLLAHHVYLRSEVPRLEILTDRVARAHGGKDPRLLGIREAWRGLGGALWEHLAEAETVVFPRLLRAEAGETQAGDAVLDEALGHLERDHAAIEGMLEGIRTLTDGFVVPAWACATYRALLEALQQLEKDTLLRFRKEAALIAATGRAFRPSAA